MTEAQDPYGDGKYEDGLSAAVHLQDAVIINERDYSQIKQLIMQYGAVQSAIYSQPDIRSLSAYYNEENAAYYYPESQECNHDIDIIGWDDTYPKENFVTEPEKDGAFICKNSWGADFGQNGFFYISYEDPNIGVYGVSYTGVEDADIRRICLDGRDLLDIMNQWPGFQAFIRRTARIHFGRQVFMLRMQTHIMIFIW